MTHNFKFRDSDSAFVSRHGWRSHVFEYNWYQHDPCTEKQAERLIYDHRRRGYESRKALALDYRHWIIHVRLPYSERPSRPSHIFRQHIWR